MNVMLISQCHQNALKHTRRILDQFAERRGERTWQTAITSQGLDTLRRLLKSSARKNTAVACHWIRSKNHTELLWIVGNQAAFNHQGAVPTNITQRDVLKARYENDWHHLPAIRLLVSLAALFHDLGKANATFLAKIKPGNPKSKPDPLRHEWVSLRLLQAWVGDDDDQTWLQRLAELTASSEKAWLDRLVKDGVDSKTAPPFKSLPPLAQSVAWLMVAHHRLPVNPNQAEQSNSAKLGKQPSLVTHNWCGSRLETAHLKPKQVKVWESAINNCWQFKAALPVVSRAWRARATKAAQKALSDPDLLTTDWLNNPYVLHLARLALMMADHHYSSLRNPRQRVKGDPDYKVHANTFWDRDTGQRIYNQFLDEHLVGVERQAASIVHDLPGLRDRLPGIARHRGFQRRVSKRRFAWQDKAYDLAGSLRQASQEHGFFGVNLASTGCGKTLGNGRIMYALADPQLGARFTLALGLRVLTLQTGDAYRERLGLGPDDLAVLVGGAAVRQLHEQHQQKLAQQEGQPPNWETMGSESAEELLPADNSVFYEASLPGGPLSGWLRKNPRAHRLLYAPILACTIDHLMPACESLRGGRQIAPMLRLLSADLVFDEPDDFDQQDLHALARLVHWSAMLGCRVLLSSATMPPALVQGLFQAYLAGRRLYQQNRGLPGLSLNVCCAWFDEFKHDAGQHGDGASFAAQHQEWVKKRVANLDKKDRPRRQVRIVGFSPREEGEEPAAIMARTIWEKALQLHQDNRETDSVTGKRVSFGLVRMANIRPLVQVTRELASMEVARGLRLHFCCYHSQHPLLVRSALEARLDRLLNRKEPNKIFSDPELRAALDRWDEDDHIFLVLATPVAEVGRDHDFDWAIVEPSSMRSIIQLAGRVRRHRPEPWDRNNMILLETNFRGLQPGEQRHVFNRPGFESEHFPLASHVLSTLLRPEQYQPLNAAPRICQPSQLDPRHNLADLEHEYLTALMLGDEKMRIATVDLFWRERAHLSGNLQTRFRFRADRGPRDTYAFVMQEEGAEPVFSFLSDDGVAVPRQGTLEPVQLELAIGVSLWGEIDYATLISDLAEKKELSEEKCSKRFCTLELYREDAEQGWFHHPALGLWRRGGG